MSSDRDRQPSGDTCSVTRQPAGHPEPTREVDPVVLVLLLLLGEDELLLGPVLLQPLLQPPGQPDTAAGLT